MTLELLSARPATRRSRVRPRREPIGSVSRGRARPIPHLSVVVPVLDEAGSLPALQAELTAALAGERYEIIYVDDGSRDGSFALLRAFHLRDPRVRVVRLRRNRGKTAAWSAGFARASGRIIVTIDADLQDDPAEIPRLLEAIAAGYDLATAWRVNRQDSVDKRLSSWCFNRASALVAGMRIHDLNCGLKVMRREVISAVDLHGDLHRFLPLLAHGKGFQVAEVPVRHRPRRFGRSKYGVGRAVASGLDLLHILLLTRFGGRPLRLFGPIGVACLAIAALASLIEAGRAITLGSPAGLWPAACLAMAGTQLLATGLVGELIRSREGRPAADPAVAETLG